MDQKVRDRTAELENVNIVLRNEILERRLAQRATSDSETRYRELAELSPEGMIVHVDGKISGSVRVVVSGAHVRIDE